MKLSAWTLRKSFSGVVLCVLWDGFSACRICGIWSSVWRYVSDSVAEEKHHHCEFEAIEPSHRPRDRSGEDFPWTSPQQIKVKDVANTSIIDSNIISSSSEDVSPEVGDFQSADIRVHHPRESFNGNIVSYPSNSSTIKHYVSHFRHHLPLRMIG